MKALHISKSSADNKIKIRQMIISHKRQVAEVCWFSVTLVMFLLLGPFAAPIVVLALFSLPAEERGVAEPESFHEAVHFQLR
ncbi:MAG: hypothetical protein EHM86_02905 [Desulfobulbaceae bacterium]|nr:MAG: hypothetical protein EHM86_02905 [Desulfobulbaceae bacterium]